MSSIESVVKSTIDEVEVKEYIERGYSERFARSVLHPLMLKEPLSAELAAEYLLATMDDPKRKSILACRNCTPAQMYYAIAKSNRYDLVDLLGAHPTHGYNKPESEELEGILTNSMFENHNMLKYISGRIHKISENTLDTILYIYLDTMEDEFNDDDGTKKLKDYKPEFDILHKYHYAKYRKTE